MNICDSALCMGCGVCADICPKHCIEMRYDQDGFLHSMVDESKCIHCQRCVSVCPALHHPNQSPMQAAYKARRTDENAVKKSTSGGIAALLSEWIVKQGGCVIGCGFDENLILKHSVATTLTELESFKGSKYIQSQTMGIYSKIKKFLQSGKLVLFVGTPCQVAGLVNFLGKPYDRLYLVDFICHGVGSQKVVDLYADHVGNSKPVTEIKFRNKDYGYDSPMRNNFKISVEDRTEEIPVGHGLTLWFASSLSTRFSCYRCPFSCVERCSDLTLADYTGRDITNEDQKYGVSYVFVNSPKGRDLFNDVSDQLIAEERDLQSATHSYYRLYHPSPVPSKRNAFFSDLGCLNIEKLEQKYTLQAILPSKIVRRFRAAMERLNKIAVYFKKQ